MPQVVIMPTAQQDLREIGLQDGQALKAPGGCCEILTRSFKCWRECLGWVVCAMIC